MEEKLYNPEEIERFKKRMEEAKINFRQGVTLDILVEYNKALAASDTDAVAALEKEYGVEKLINPLVNRGTLFVPHEKTRLVANVKETYLSSFLPLSAAIRSGNLAMVAHVMEKQDLRYLRSEWAGLKAYAPLKIAARNCNTRMLAYLLTYFPKEQVVGVLSDGVDYAPAAEDKKMLATINKAKSLADTILANDRYKVDKYLVDKFFKFEVEGIFESLSLYSRLACTAKDIFSKEPFNTLPMELWQIILSVNGNDAFTTVSGNKSKNALKDIAEHHKDASTVEKQLLWLERVTQQSDSLSISQSTGQGRNI